VSPATRWSSSALGAIGTGLTWAGAVVAAGALGVARVGAADGGADGVGADDGGAEGVCADGVGAADGGAEGVGVADPPPGSEAGPGAGADGSVLATTAGSFAAGAE